ncbi:MAG TPA: radical SAM protein [Polyangia bacterium]|jgi:radical SAM superfamily enzyme YgiQ (UPF0313 family)|nr:radical SAM protein [Polyangia bacterium]
MPWIALVGPEFEENLSLRYLASSLAAAGFQSEILAFNRPGDLPGVVAAIVDRDDAQEPPLLVGLSLAFQWRAKDFLALAMALRAAGYSGHITAGGHFATFACRELLRDFPELDSICRQESEETLVEVARALVAGSPLTSIAGLALRGEQGEPVLTGDPALPDLERLPWPDRRGRPASCFGHGIAPLVGSRGCYANCSFCCIAAWHEQSLPGKRYRLRDVEDIADEMVALERERGVEVFVFHDDNFFLPGHRRNVERLSALADALEARGIGRFATVVKARPTDVDPEVFRILRHRLHCIRTYVGVETDADQGLMTLNRWAHSKQNHRAIEVVRELGLYTCFNLLLFDPDTTLADLERNLTFIRAAAEFPFNFGRVELYAGTPLLGRMQLEERCWGDYLQWDYELASPEVARVYRLTMTCFHARNFGDGALANNLMGTRFDVEVARHFHPDVFRPEWLARGQALSQALSHDTADGLAAIVGRVKGGAPAADDDAFCVELSARLRAREETLSREARALAQDMAATLGRGRPLTEIGDLVATPLQDARTEVMP